MSINRPRLIVLGTGFAAFSLVKEIDVERYDVRIISPRNHFLFSPLLPSTTVGTIEFRSIIEPIRTARRGIRYHQARCLDINTKTNTLFCEGYFKQTPFEMHYDKLVIAVGALSNTFGVPGVNEYATFLKELRDARRIRQRIIECFERASKPDRPVKDFEWLLHFLVVGGGPTGVEFAAEMHDFITQDILKWFPELRDYIKITLLEAGDEILTSFDAKLSAYTISHFKRQNINVRTKSPVVEVTENYVMLQSGEKIPYGLLVWSTGNGPRPLILKLASDGFAMDRTKRLITDETFLLKGTSNVYVVGDCACIEANPLPPTAQVAQQSGKHLAKNLNRMVRDKEAQPFAYRHMGMLAYIGKRRALADMSNYKSKGFTTWLFWRSAYLTKLISTKNKMLVIMDWMKAAVFGRDISRF